MSDWGNRAERFGPVSRRGVVLSGWAMIAWVIIAWVIIAWAWAPWLSAQENSPVPAQATVGSVGRIDELLLPGSLLQAKPMEDRDLPVVVRIVESFPHGDSHRYHLTFMALEPGRYDLRQFLERVDGRSAGDLPEVLVEVVSVLAPGHVPPNQLSASWPRVGSYRFWAILAVVVWVAALLLLICWSKKKPVPDAEPAAVLTLAELLRPRLEAAALGELDDRQLAELERWIVEFWRRRLGLLNLPPKEALLQLRASDAAGPLLQQMERWLHGRHRDPNISLGQLLQPYRDLHVADDLESPLPPVASRASVSATGGAG